jgi:hypothetical protein
MARLTHKATDHLSADALRLMTAGFRQRKTYRAIAADLAAIGVKVPERTIARRGVEWRTAQSRRDAAREQIQDLVAAMKHNDWNAAEMLQALAIERLVECPEAWAGQDPMRVQGQSLAAQQVRVREREVAVREREIALAERKIQLLEKRDEQARELAAESERRDMTPAEMRAKIREIYGLSA